MTLGSQLGWQDTALSTLHRSHGVWEAVPGGFSWTHLSRGRDVERIRQEVGVASLWTFCCVQLPKITRHLAHMVEAGLQKFA